MAKMLGSVDLLGLNAFGKNPGMNALYGTLIGGGASGVTSILLKRRGASNPDAKGFLVGVVVAGVLWSMKKTRHSAFGALAGAFFASGLSWVAGKLLGAGAGATAAAVAGMGLPQLQYLNGGGGLGVAQIQYLNGAGGMGLPGLAPVPPSYGTAPGVAGLSISGLPPVDLLGRASNGSQQASLLGSPALSGLSSAYGATLLNGGRN